MTSIKLTEEHKSKILEMCKELFPEYVIYPADNDGFIEGEQWVGDQNMGEDRPVNEFNIHWFEFCHEYLVEKIFGNPKNTLQGINQRPYWCEKVAESFAKVHPVDYLYEQ